MKQIARQQTKTMWKMESIPEDNYKEKEQLIKEEDTRPSKQQKNERTPVKRRSRMRKWILKVNQRRKEKEKQDQRWKIEADTLFIADSLLEDIATQKGL